LNNRKNYTMERKGSQKFAILLCKFSDSQDIEPQPATYFQDLFANRGTGGLNDYWSDASKGNIDLNGTEILGWKVIDQTRNDFVNARPGRWDKILGAIGAFDLDTSKYAGIVALFNVSVDDSGTQNGVLGGPTDYNVTFLGHETGHVFGLEHSFDQSDRKDATWSAPGEYFDMSDIMSAMNVYSSNPARFGPVGPLLNTPGMDRMGWLDPLRVWTPTNVGSSDSYQFDLVSLGHPEIPGYLAARIGGVYVEFRTKDGWDAAIPRPGVLLHEMPGVNPIVLASDKANYVNDWQPGQVYGPPDLDFALFGGARIRVDNFDLPAKKARITVTRRASRPIVVGPGQIFGGVAVDGGGWVILPSGKIVPVPPRSPVTSILEKLAVVLEAEKALQPQAQKAVSRAVYGDVVRTLRTALKGSPHESQI
jgi:hypothetical protein